mmetsp:Transcript_12247/g.20963  ORF Transcript_12247/g.20963 Transcript_12247/m.20963 type:complete len:225 (-) Transcript_12247:36-710(-)
MTRELQQRGLALELIFHEQHFCRHLVRVEHLLQGGSVAAVARLHDQNGLIFQVGHDGGRRRHLDLLKTEVLSHLPWPDRLDLQGWLLGMRLDAQLLKLLFEQVGLESKKVEDLLFAHIRVVVCMQVEAVVTCELLKAQLVIFVVIHCGPSDLEVGFRGVTSKLRALPSVLHELHPCHFELSLGDHAVLVRVKGGDHVAKHVLRHDGRHLAARFAVHSYSHARCV